MIFIISIIILLILAGIIFLIPKLGLKIPCSIIIALTVFVTGYLAIAKPVLHKPLSMSVIEYLVKINTDGSVTTTKQTTTTQLGKTK